MKKFKTWNWLKIGAWTIASVIVCSALVYFNFFHKQAQPVIEEETLSINTVYKIENGNFALDEGKTFDLADHRGDVIVLNFWATWCQPCKDEIPHFNEVYEKYKDLGLEVVIISTDYMSETALLSDYLNNPSISDYAKYYGNWRDFTCTFAKDTMANDILNRFDDSGALPVTVVIDREGNQVYAKAGALSAQALEDLILPYLQAK